jgi:hypothetical protein
MVFEEKWFIIIHDKRCRCAMNHLLGKRKKKHLCFFIQMMLHLLFLLAQVFVSTAPVILLQL